MFFCVFYFLLAWGHAKFLCIIPTLVYVLLKQALLSIFLEKKLPNRANKQTLWGDYTRNS